MHSFKPEILSSLANHQITRALGVIHETRGKQELYLKQKPDVLKNLQQVAIIESTESSNRLEGATAPPVIFEKIVQSGEPLNSANRSEAEIAGYRQVLGQLHDQHTNMPLNPNIMLQLHRDLMKFTTEKGGYWKKGANDITEIHPDGTKHIRAQTTPPHLVEA